MSLKRFTAANIGASVTTDVLLLQNLTIYARKFRQRVFFMLIFFIGNHYVWSQCALSCRTSVQIALSQTGQTQVTPSVVLQSLPSGCGVLSVVLKDSLNNTYGDLAGCSMIGKYMVATVSEAGSGNSCWTRIYVKDNIPPTVACTDQYVFCNQPTAPSAIGFPSISDNCSAVTTANLSFVDVLTDLPCNSNSPTGVVVTAKIKRTWTATDAYGNVGTCSHHVYLRRATLVDVQFPANRDDVSQPALQCGQSPANFALTGKPSVVNIPIDNAGFCELAVSYTDQVVPICGTGSYKILREWRVVDWCASQFLISVQVIIVKDTQAPTISCPANTTFNTNVSNCFSTLSLPAATASDNCSAVNINSVWSFGSGAGPFINATVGTHIVTYTAKDACNNTSSCTARVTVVDNRNPIAVCNQYKEVALGSNGQGFASAASFDNGSNDNCTLQKVRVSRDSIVFDSIVNFTCADIGTSIRVTMRVYDAGNLTNDCTINVSVKDKLNPTISCPANVTLNCTDDFNAIALTGIATATDNCHVQSIVKQDISALNACREGIITRTWRATDGSGNTRTCQQIITKVDTSPIVLTFPPDYTGYACGQVTDTSVCGSPVVVGDNCELIAMAYVDQIYPVAAPACYKIVRSWQVINWCKYVPNANSNVGIWTHQQIIKVLDTIAPVLTPPADLTVGATGSNCDAAAIVPLATATDCSNGVTITNDSPYATAHGADASGTYPPGTHTITYSVFDGCGNFATASMQMFVRDSKPPTPVCLNGISIPLQQDGTVTLTKAMIESGASNDNCTPYASLQFVIAPTLFSCNELGYQIVKLTATDLSGNTSFCTSTVFIQDNANVCTFPTDLASVSGTILTEQGDFVNDINVSLNGAMSKDTVSNYNGVFMFSSLPRNGGYNIRPHSNNSFSNGVSTLDLVLMRRHILGIELLGSPYKIIAADANKSGSVSTLDMVELRKIILQVVDTLPSNTSWRFVDAAYTFVEPSNPWADGFPEQISVSNLNTNASNKNLIAIKIGDVNNSVDAANTRSEGQSKQILVEDQLLEAGKTYEIALKAKDFKGVVGAQWQFAFEPYKLTVLGVKKAALRNFDANNIGWSQAKNGRVALSWDDADATGQTVADGEILLYATVEAQQNTRLSAAFRFDDGQQMRPEAYAADGTQYEMQMQFYQKETEKGKFELYQNRPNPFAETTAIGFYLPRESDVTIEIFDMAGRLCKRAEQHYPQGYNELTVSTTELSFQNGMFYYRLRTSEGASETKLLSVYRP